MNDEPRFSRSRANRRQWRLGRRRHAITLLEVIGATSVLLVIGVSAASILGKVSEVGSRSNHAQQVRISVERLATAFRRDIQQADEIRVAPPGALIEISSGELVTRFRWDETNSDITRESTDSQGVQQFERFVMRPSIQPECTQAGEIIALNLVDKGLVHPWTIEARQR